MGQSKDQTQIPAVKVVTERSHLPKNLESRLQAAWLSAVAPPSGRKVKPAEPSSAISSSDHPKLTKTENRSALLKRQRSDKSIELAQSLEILFMRTKGDKRRASLRSVDEMELREEYPTNSSKSAGFQNNHVSSVEAYENNPAFAEDMLRLELEASQFDDNGAGMLQGEAVEEEFYKGISGLQDALDEMELHLPKSTDFTPNMSNYDFSHELLGYDGGVEVREDVDFIEEFLQNVPSVVDEERTSSLMSGGSDSSLEGASRLEIEEMEASEPLNKLQKECERRKANNKGLQNQCVVEGSPVRLLVDVARAIVAGDRETSQYLLKRLSNVASAYGTMTQRLSVYFLKGLNEKIANENPEVDINGRINGDPLIYSQLSLDQLPEKEMESETIGKPLMESFEVVMNASPFLTFGQVAANSAILEACRNESEIHILDLGIGLALQWPALIQAMAVRRNGPPKITLTGIDPGNNGKQALYCMESTKDKLMRIARAWGVQLNFQILDCPISKVTREYIGCGENIPLIVNCPLRLHRILGIGNFTEGKETCLKTIRMLHPKICSVVEQNDSRHSPYFLARFYEALYYYLTLFESLEKSVPENTAGKQIFEEQVLGKAIVDIVAGRGQERCEEFSGRIVWKEKMLSLGFKLGSISDSTVATVKALLDTYRSGYGLLHGDGSLTLTWDDKPLLVMKVWEPK